MLLDTVNNSKAEKEAILNLSISGSNVKIAIKTICPKFVSCANILALAALDVVSSLVNYNLSPLQQQVFSLFSFHIH